LFSLGKTQESQSEEERSQGRGMGDEELDS
jgi:hypothetical protein